MITDKDAKEFHNMIKKLEEQNKFKSNPVAKQVRTPKFKSQVVTSKKVYNRKKLNHEEI